MKNGRKRFWGWRRLELVAGISLGIAALLWPQPAVAAETPERPAPQLNRDDSSMGGRWKAEQRPLPAIDRAVQGPTRIALFAYG